VREAASVATVTQLRKADFSKLLLDFLAYLEFERGLARNTLDAYRTDLLQFGRFLEQHHSSAQAATGPLISEFLTELATGKGRPPASTATIHRKTACLRSFYRHLRREGIVDDDPTASLTGRGAGASCRECSRAGRSRSCLRRPGAAGPRPCVTGHCSS
jgi:integrase/recombinase XerD